MARFFVAKTRTGPAENPVPLTAWLKGDKGDPGLPGDVTAGVASLNGRTGTVTLTKTDVALANVDNTADAAKAVLSATKLLTARTINGVAFDGTGNVTINATDATARLAASAASAYGLTLLDDADAATARSTLGAQVAGAYITGTGSASGTNTGDQDDTTVPFLQGGTGANSETVRTALRREVWADSYKLAADTDDVASITRAVAALNTAGGGVVRLSRRDYILNSNITITATNNVKIQGATFKTLIRSTVTTGDTITFTNCQQCNVDEVYFWPTVRKTSGYALSFTGSSYLCRANVRCDYGYNGVSINNATECRIRASYRYMLGAVGTYFGGTVGVGSYRAIIEDQQCDNPYPISAGSNNVKAFSASMALNAGDVIVTNGAAYQATTGGTAAATAPSGYPSGTSPESVFTGTITSGTAVLRWISSSTLTWILQDSYGYSLVINNAALIDGAFGYAMRDSANTGSSYPIWTYALNLETDHSLYGGVELDRGEGFFDAGMCWIGSVLGGNGVVIGANYRGNVAFGPASRITGNAQNGVLRQAGPLDIRFVGTEVTDNSAVGSGTHHGINIAANSVDTSITDARCGDSISVGGNSQGYGIFVGTGCDKLTIMGCNVRGNTTGGIGLSTGVTNSFIENNPGYNPVGLAGIVVGASPFTYTAGPTSETLFLFAGTVSDVKIQGLLVAQQTNTTLSLRPNQSVVITYSVAPALNKSVS